MLETISKNAYEPCSNNNKGPIYEAERLQIEELDEWQTQKSRTPDKPKLSQDKLNTSPNHLKVGDKVLLDAADPHIATSEPNEEIPLTVLSIFPYGTVEVIHPKFATFKASNTRLKPYVDRVDSRDEKWFFHPHDQAHGRAVSCAHTTRGDTAVCYGRVKIGKNLSSTWDVIRLFFEIVEPTLEFYLTFHLQTIMTNFENHGMVQFYLGGLVRQDLVPTSATYDPSCSKALALLLSLRYLHAILAYTLTGRRESTGFVTTHDAYFLWSMANGHVLDLAYFIALAIRHQTERHRRGVIFIGPYVTGLARHFGLLNIVAQSSSYTLIGQMSPQGISSMLSMRIIGKRRGNYPPQCRLMQSTKEEDPEEITDDVPPRHEDPPSQPPPIHHPIHAVASYSDISERLKRFE
ncbi:hypothetical protein GOBAR_AA20590 [Gossypium barbadense]|uniref:Uncharacterized protein n=1 Tax=Gossypium barbadense TaxID=3634 RepID=A0A2P5X9T1_GOSBA|nr:hypothetical protein GOBAR_AA20590 [Gossypium barbadense]